MGIAFWIGMFLLNPPAAAGQDVRGARLEDAVELLHSDDIRVREEAEEALSQLPVFWIPALRALAASERDLEAKCRLKAAIGVQSSREGQRLFEEGRLEESLRWFVDLSEEAAAADRVIGVKESVAGEIRALMPECLSTDDLPQEFAPYAELIVNRFGPWGIAVLIDALANPESDLPAVELLRTLGDDVVPCLSRALREGSAFFKKKLCDVLHGMTEEQDRTIPDEEGLSTALEDMAADPLTDSRTRNRIRTVLGRVEPRACSANPFPAPEDAP
ncbi:MAG TPA: hypothetical protein VKW04_08665 [Planctomycetota bacterium]|nr:hypothetical protein [Planctomycetota bacterium]